jgi:hypothetical protein
VTIILNTESAVTKLSIAEIKKSFNSGMCGEKSLMPLKRIIFADLGDFLDELASGDLLIENRKRVWDVIKNMDGTSGKRATKT